MSQHEQERPKRYCMVCGHPMLQMQRICEVCGSIMRPAKGGGRPIAPERHSSCERCGEVVPFGKQYCSECSEYLKEHEKKRTAESSKRSAPGGFLRWLKSLFARG